MQPGRHPGWIVTTDVAGQATARRAAQPCADLLRHSSHQGVGEWHQPQQGETNLCAGLRICSDPAGVVIGSAGDHVRAKEASRRGLDGPTTGSGPSTAGNSGSSSNRFGHGTANHESRRAPILRIQRSVAVCLWRADGGIWLEQKASNQLAGE